MPYQNLRARLDPDFPRPDDGFIESTIGRVFEHQAAASPDHIAIEDEHQSLTYRELDARVNQVANALLAHGSDNFGVVLLFDSGVTGVIAILGALKSGGYFVFLDPLYPRDRLSYLMEDSGASIVLCDDNHLDLAKSFATGGQTILPFSETASLPISRPSPDCTPETMCLLIYTSGSTGQPKGVMHTHRNFLQSTWQGMWHYAMTPACRVGLSFSLSFGGAYKYLLVALLSGATLLPYNLKRNGLNHFAGWVRDRKPTFFQLTTSSFRQFCALVPAGERFPALRFILTGGEPVLQSDIDLFQHTFGEHVSLRIGGGTSEALLMGEGFVGMDTDMAGNPVPMGPVHAGFEITIRDVEGNLLPEGERGEIVVRSGFLSPGYWQRPELTAAAFGSDPDGMRFYKTGDVGLLDGDVLVHLGRADNRLKVRGYRVEPGEVESVLLRIKGVKQAAVVGRTDSIGNTQMVAYLEVDEAKISEIRGTLDTTLPEYMIPARIVLLDKLPRTASEKIAKAELPEVGTQRPEIDVPYEAPHTPVEKAIAAIWSEVLQLDELGIHDPFLMVGGNSLTATQVANRVQALTDREINLMLLFNAPTIAEIAALIE